MDYAKQLKVLIVEPSAYIGGILRDLLQGTLEIQTVFDARRQSAAAEVLLQNRINLLIIKVDVDFADGVALIKAVRSGYGDVPQDLPIIGVTAAPTRQLVGQLRDLGVNEILALPPTAKAMAERIQSVFEHPRDWVVSANYVGPDRRRKKGVQYKGTERRDADDALLLNDDIGEPITTETTPS